MVDEAVERLMDRADALRGGTAMSKPAASAPTTSATNCLGPDCSPVIVYPILTVPGPPSHLAPPNPAR